MTGRNNNIRRASPVREVRLVRLVNILQRGRPVSRKELQAELEVSRATLTRDITTLRDQLNMPVAFDPDAQGYILTNKHSDIGPQYQLPGLWLSDREAMAVLTLVNVSASIDPGILDHLFMPLRGWMKKLSGLPFDRLPPIDEKLSIELDFGRDYRFEIFREISTALYLDQQVSIKIRNMDCAFEKASIQRYILKTDGWYIDLYDMSSSNVVRVPMDRIESVRSMKTKAKRLSLTEDGEWLAEFGRIIPNEQLQLVE